MESCNIRSLVPAFRSVSTVFLELFYGATGSRTCFLLLKSAPVVWTYHIMSVASPVDGGLSPVWPKVNRTAKSICVQVWCGRMFSFLLGRPLGVESLGHMAVLYFWISINFSLRQLFKKCLFITFEWQRKREGAQEWGRGRERGRQEDLKWALCRQQTAWCGVRTHEPKTMTWAQVRCLTWAT